MQSMTRAGGRGGRSRGWDVLPENSGGRPDYGRGNFVRFELASTLSAGGSATAYRRRWDGTTWTTTTSQVTVYDSLGSFSGPAGKYGWAWWCDDSHRWEIVQLQC